MKSLNNLTIKIIKKANCKNLSLRVCHDSLITLSAPKNCPTKQCEAFILQHQQWIEAQRKKFLLSLERIPVDCIYLFGAYQPITNPTLQEHWQAILKQPQPKNKQYIIKFYRTKLQAILDQECPILAKQMQLFAKSIGISLAKSQLGSCSSQKNINFSLLLSLCPIFVIQSVIIHEFAHLRHLNHSPHFWNLVRCFDSNLKESQTWLAKNAQFYNMLFAKIIGK